MPRIVEAIGSSREPSAVSPKRYETGDEDG
jgi:hypothetical protein